MPNSSSDRERTILAWAFARLDVAAFVIAGAVVAGLALFALTLVVVLKGAAPNVPVGPHLAQLGLYFPGYSVSVGGACVGLLYAAAVGGVGALVLAMLWNFAHKLLFSILRTRATLTSYTLD